MKRTLLLDGDILAFMATTSTEYVTQWSPTLWTLHANLDEGIAKFDDSLQEIVESLGGDRVVVALSDYSHPRWRNARVMPEYKASRKPKRKPITYQPLREYIEEKYETFERPGLEGDDVLGILLTDSRFAPGTEKVVVSIDKDMLTLPGLHINFAHCRELGEWEPRTVAEDEANYMHFIQSLTGDPTDGYRGCPTIGPKRGAKILEPWFGQDGMLWATIVTAYAKQGLGEEVALMNARVARICRVEDYDFAAKEVILWQPPN